ncbi:MAG: hypothetical protein WA919_02855 [Coleofasciculaceae cyanobacterium]
MSTLLPQRKRDLPSMRVYKGYILPSWLTQPSLFVTKIRDEIHQILPKSSTNPGKKETPISDRL